jgi:hypothetical protein
MSTVRVPRFRKRPVLMACSSDPRSAYSSNIHVSINVPCRTTAIAPHKQGITCWSVPVEQIIVVSSAGSSQDATQPEEPHDMICGLGGSMCVEVLTSHRACSWAFAAKSLGSRTSSSIGSAPSVSSVFPLVRARLPTG